MERPTRTGEAVAGTAGRSADLNRSVQQAAAMLRARMDELWTATRLAQEVNLSRAHLTRAFTQQVGLAPMRFLIEVRLTEFTRLMEETDPVSRPGRSDGWRREWRRHGFNAGLGSPRPSTVDTLTPPALDRRRVRPAAAPVYCRHGRTRLAK
jgi:AraC-like DNA-binding protein